MNDLGHSSDNPYATSKGSEGRRTSRTGKKYRVVPSPLMSINWWRIALDEAQRVETPTAASARMALKLISEHRWCVSGTPIGRGRMQDLFGLLLFLGARPFCEKDWFQASVKPNYCDVKLRIGHMLQDTLWRSTKANDTVRQQMGIPEQVETKLFLKFSSIERHFYQRQLEETILAAHLVIGDFQSKKRKRKAKDTDMLSHHLHRLRAACCHPQVGSSGISKVQKSSSNYDGTSVANGVLSMSQILDRLIDDAKVKSEEAQRLYTLNTNAIACLYKLKAESGVRSGSFLDEDDEVALLQKSCQAYIEAIEVADTNSAPCSIVGEACLSGSIGFQSPGKVVRDGSASLQWLLHIDEGGKTPEIWSRFDFSGATKKITSIAVRPVKNLSNYSSSHIFVYPRACVLQVSNAAIGGLFVDALSFTLSRPVCSTGEEIIQIDWQQFKGFRPHKSKSWRILVKDYYPTGKGNQNSASAKLCVALEVQLMEPDIVPDSLQRLHILHNGVLTLNILQEKRNDSEKLSIEGDTHSRFAADKVEATISAMKDEQKSLEAHYIEGARVLQLTSQSRLNDATRKRRKLLDKLVAVDRSRSNAERQPWWQDLFAYCHLHLNPRLQSSLTENVEQSLSDLHNDPSQPFNRRSFPVTDTVDGLNIAFNMRLHDNSFFAEVIDNDVYTCIETIHKLSDHPSPAEIFENSHCHKCRSDWDQNGPKCQCCKLEEQLVEYQTHVKNTEINCVLSSMFHWMRQNLNKYQQASKIGSINLKSLSKKAEIFFELRDEVIKELDSAKSKWRTHFDLLSDIDELNQCKRTMRLAYEDENLYGLSPHEQAFIVQPRDIAGQIMDHTAKQAMAEGNLRRTKELLRFLKNQNIERMRIVEGDSSDESNTCCICLCTFEKERAVLRCGHTYHFSPCLERLFARGGGHNTITCPMRCAMRTKRDEILIASDISRDDGSKVAKKIKGQWGTKVRNVCILMIMLGFILKRFYQKG
jgi:E3 ubiquitin-protein ligase SHPRH